MKEKEKILIFFNYVESFNIIEKFYVNKYFKEI